MGLWHDRDLVVSAVAKQPACSLMSQDHALPSSGPTSIMLAWGEYERLDWERIYDGEFEQQTQWARVSSKSYASKTG